MPTAAKKNNIFEKMALVMGELDGLAPTGKNDHFRYDYWETNEVSNTFRKLFVKHGLAFLADVVDVRVDPRGKGYLTTMTVEFSIWDTDDPSAIIVKGKGVGQGDDNSDKGANKAFSGALKYWLLKTFLLGGEDAENAKMETAARSVTIESSNITGIERGGRSRDATDLQVRRVAEMARDLEYGPEKMAELIESVLNMHLDLPEDPGEHGAVIRKYLSGVEAEEIGRLIQYMEMMGDKKLADDRADS